MFYVAIATQFAPSRPTNPPVESLPQYYYLLGKDDEKPVEVQAFAPETTAGPGILELREVVNNIGGATLAASQPPTITTQWVETVLKSGVTTWVEIIYTQTFAKVVSQGASPGVGEIGMGTLTGAIGVYRTHNAAPRGVSLPGRSRGSEGLIWGGIWGTMAVLMGAISFGARLW